MASNLYTEMFLAGMGMNPVYLRVLGIFGSTSLTYFQGFPASLGARRCLSPVIPLNASGIESIPQPIPQ
jgi:hypothetical protein